MLNGVWIRRKRAFIDEPRISIEYRHRFTTRFFLNLRSIAYHQRTSMFESHARSFENPTVQTRPPRKLGRLWTNMFADLDMDKTAYSRGTNPIEVNIEQVDVIDLDDIGPQADQQRK